MKPLIRPLTPSDYARVVEISNYEANQPESVEEMEYFIRTWPEGYPVIRLVAELDGRVVGSGGAGNGPWMKPREFFFGVEVDPAYRRQGAGSALYAALEEFVAEHKPPVLRSGVKDDKPEALAWAEKRGFVKQHHIFDSYMNPSTFDETLFAGAVEKALADGFRFIHFSTIQSPETEQQLWKMNGQMLEDVPDAADRHVSPFDQWRRWFLESPGAWPEGCLIALAPGGDWAALSAMRCNPAEPDRASISITGVARAYRGQNLSLALKLYGIRYLREKGVTRLVTNNHSGNARMLAVNRKLGYTALPGQFFLKKSLISE